MMSEVERGLRRFLGRTGTVLWGQLETRIFHRAPMILMDETVHLHMMPLLGRVGIVQGQIVRVSFDDVQANLVIRFNSRVADVRGNTVLLRPPASVEEDRRHAERAPLRAPLAIRRPGANLWVPATGVDISVGGVSLLTDLTLQHGDAVEIQVSFTQEAPLILTATVRRIESRQLGASWGKLPEADEERILAYVLAQRVPL